MLTALLGELRALELVTAELGAETQMLRDVRADLGAETRMLREVFMELQAFTARAIANPPEPLSHEDLTTFAKIRRSVEKLERREVFRRLTLELLEPKPDWIVRVFQRIREGEAGATSRPDTPAQVAYENQIKRVADLAGVIRALVASDLPAGGLRHALAELVAPGLDQAVVMLGAGGGRP